jgi:hypothetical protein
LSVWRGKDTHGDDQDILSLEGLDEGLLVGVVDLLRDSTSRNGVDAIFPSNSCDLVLAGL